MVSNIHKVYRLFVDYNYVVELGHWVCVEIFDIVYVLFGGSIYILYNILIVNIYKTLILYIRPLILYELCIYKRPEKDCSQMQHGDLSRPKNLTKTFHKTADLVSSVIAANLATY